MLFRLHFFFILSNTNIIFSARIRIIYTFGYDFTEDSTKTQQNNTPYIFNKKGKLLLYQEEFIECCCRIFYLVIMKIPAEFLFLSYSGENVDIK